MMFDEKKRFLIKGYNRRKPFASFLPGIAGIRGIPLWNFYVNRGQAVCSFGSHDKQHPIMEFFPAGASYQLVRQRGFRTFLKADGQFYEPFSSDDLSADMYIGKNELCISETNERIGLRTEVVYTILPEERLGALARQVTVINLNSNPVKLECADGMACLIPYGATLRDMKEVTQLIQAWMMVEHTEEKTPFYHLSASSDDSTQVSEIHAGNFYLAFDKDGNRLDVIVDPDVLFAYDSQMRLPVSFIEKPLKELLKEEQVTENQLSSAFGCIETVLQSGESMQINSLIGHAEDYRELREFTRKCCDSRWFAEKEARAVSLTDEITRDIETRTASPLFDEYCAQTYLDNLLRGGYPVRITGDRPFYVYSRKHGDLERDYNSFSMSPEFYSQGNGNYRDVSQNRRSDLIFSPFVKDYNIKRFYNLIQLDGCNPLVLLQSRYSLASAEDALKGVSAERQEELNKLLLSPFTPGHLAMQLKEEEAHLFGQILENSREEADAELDDGYWTDHWTYNLDMVESFLQIFPKEEKSLLFDDRSYTWYAKRAEVLPRKNRYARTPDGLRQFGVIEKKEKKDDQTWERTGHGSGEIYRSCLAEKMFLLSIMKFAALDMKGKGVEMEGGKPGWYDALNGLPALFGSSMCESYELKRQILFLAEKLEAYKMELKIPAELKTLIDSMEAVLADCKAGEASRFDVWNRINRAKEAYREQIADGISGEEYICSAGEALALLIKMERYLDDGIETAVRENHGIPPAYCAYSIRDFREKDGIIEFRDLEEMHMPDFLEGPVRYLKLPLEPDKKRELYRRIRESDLYDRKLGMYKVNAPLTDAPHEIGRARAFSRGWLENESIWLHMEYKYLLELIRSGLYKEFFEDLKTACIPFMDFEIYGRSLTENSSFIVSSVHPNKKIHGHGYVARLSGSTAEFLSMWQLMFLGDSFIRMESGSESCRFAPAIPAYLIPEDGRVKARIFGTTDIVYQISGKGDVIPGSYRIMEYEIQYEDGRTDKKPALGQDIVTALRNGKITAVTVSIEL